MLKEPKENHISIEKDIGQQNFKKVKKTEESLKELWGNMIHSHIIGIL